MHERPNERAEAILSALSEGVSFQDREFRILYQNPAHRALFGDQIKRYCYEAVERSNRVCEGCPLDRVFHDGLPHTAVRSVTVTSGEIRLAEISASPVRDREGSIIGGIEVARELPGQVRTKQLLEEALAQLERERKRADAAQAVERFTALGRMASGVAHEINNPLSAINGCAEGLADRIDRGAYDPRLFRQYLSIIQEEVFRCKGITESMLSITRDGSCEQKRISLEPVVRSAVKLASCQGKLRDVTVHLDLEPGLPEIWGSEGELLQVLLTVITNGLDAMEGRGRLTISGRANTDTVTLAVSDSGPGIADECRERIFEPFFSTKAGMCGGLGLSIAKRIVENHGGTISTESRNGGATFVIMLPRKRTEKEESGA